MRSIIPALAAGLLVLLPTYGHANQLDQLLTPSKSQLIATEQKLQITLVRETILKETALLLGARAGLSDRSAELMRLMNSRQSALDTKFMFGELVIGNNVLPPVISESRDVVSLDETAMRVAGVIYRIDEPARFALPTPTWRNYLYLGLDETPLKSTSMVSSNLPETPVEQAYWEKMVRQGYESGRAHAQELFDANFARLERDFEGMKRFYDLYRRKMVSEPVIASAHEIVQREDESTIAVGNTIFRITQKTDFTAPSLWTPLE